MVAAYRMVTVPVEQADLPPYRHRGPCPRCARRGPIGVHFDRDCTEARGDHFLASAPAGIGGSSAVSRSGALLVMRTDSRRARPGALSGV
jgi:hypothetical protein